jgi:hypothetical protein
LSQETRVHTVAKPEVARYVVVYSPTYEKVAEDCEEELQGARLGVPIVRIPTKAGGYIPNGEALNTMLEPGDAVGVIGGDGTYGDVAGGLVIPGLIRAAQDVAVTSLNGGRARDIGKAQHRHPHDAPSKLFKGSKAVEGFALKTVARTGNETITGIAMSYNGWGKSAIASAKMALPGFKDGTPAIEDLKIGLYALYGKDYLQIIDQDGERRELGDLTFAKGSRMAKIGRLPVEHWHEEFLVSPVKRGLVAAHIASAGLLVGHPVGFSREDDYHFTTMTDTWTHFDGDPPVRIPGGTDVTVGLADQSYTLLTTRL